MLAGLLALPVAAYLSMSDSPDVRGRLESMQTGLTSLWGPGGASLENVFIIVGYMSIGLGFLGSPQVFVRLISIRDEQEIRKGRWVAIVFTLLTDTGGFFERSFLSTLFTKPPRMA
ncbi:MAG: hypothetical protein ABGZ23_03470 [Fuerstiella sp.]|nr:hypothetical protein [Fuerstiella sp.]